MIEADQLSRRFGALMAVEGVDLRVEPGQVLGLLGPNGAGKSTLMRMLAGYLSPSGGRALIDGIDVWASPVKAKRRLGYLPEGAPSYGEMTVREFLYFIGRIRGMTLETGRRRLDRVVQELQLEAVMDQIIESLSKGLRRRVGLAQAILHDPPVLMLDEPTDGLDPNQKHTVRQLIDAMARDRTILVSTHLLEEVHALCNRVSIMAAGKVLVNATPAELERSSRYHGAVSFSAPGSSLAQEMLGRLPQVAGIEVDPIDGRITVFPRSGERILEAVEGLLAMQGLQVSEIQLERGRLDEVFRELTCTPPARSAREAP
ncbi:ABC transporter ATP-binding protein [Frateuria aurantia]|uniref:ABC-type multidrug transport system, ATPase component n=1 Tax=Frateuria aurantia (strain ATCC 33424 / DSM 6220 / KCTC 2777 / LMG 1558 / NBRC 3245 / NCIMB 13370) TaxID=767434 RepID=H8KZZ5_FRAAD|nr:ABC transporter ATP-binding protein [Frateuria aurantia]AFC85276.1 ABC-type multidrug transport system, ATPase component [Frateuria aurantia DSM 6220]